MRDYSLLAACLVAAVLASPCKLSLSPHAVIADASPQQHPCVIIANDGPVGVCGGRDPCSFVRRTASQQFSAYLLTPSTTQPGEVDATYQWTRDAASLPVSPSAAAGRPSAASTFDVGILYEFWHGFASHAMSYVSAQNGTLLTVEDVIRSNGSLVVADILQKYGAAGLNDGFYYHATPAYPEVNNGFYCIYSKRSNESSGWIPDCNGINVTLARHAAQLLAAGVHYVVTDETNLPTWSQQADVIQLRPLEVIFETWAALRAAGTPTPAITAWQCIPPGATNWEAILALYNTYSDLVYRDPASGKMVWFIPTSNPDPTIIAAIEANGGANNIIVQEMWAEFAESSFDYLWAFFSPCTATTSNGMSYTTSVVGLGRGATACGQLMTTNSTLGTALTVSPSLQLNYGSLPFTETNKYDGLTLKRQFGTLLDAQLAGAGPAHVFLSSWNEWIAQPQPNPYKSPYSFSMGLPWDPESVNLWVDTYGSSNSRDLEPSVEYGTLLYDIMSSCLRVATLTSTLQTAVENDAAMLAAWLGRGANTTQAALRAALQAAVRSSAAARLASPCTVAGEICCAYNDTTDGYAVVWPLTLNSGADALLTGDPNELSNLTCPSCGWTQTCNPYSGPTDFCVDAALVTSPLALQGPFVLHNGGCGAVATQAESYAAARGDVLTPGAVLADRVPLYRCYDGTHHFFGTDASCGGATLEQTLGCMHATSYSNMARALRKCVAASSGVTYHVMDGACAAGDADGGVLGYVR